MPLSPITRARVVIFSELGFAAPIKRTSSFDRFPFGIFGFSLKKKRLRDETITFVPLEAEERSKQREIRWISLNGNPSSEKMTTSDNCLVHIHGIVRGETANLGDLFFSRSGDF